MQDSNLVTIRETGSDPTTAQQSIAIQATSSADWTEKAVSQPVYPPEGSSNKRPGILNWARHHRRCTAWQKDLERSIQRMSQAYLSPLPEQVPKNKCSVNGHKWHQDEIPSPMRFAPQASSPLNAIGINNSRQDEGNMRTGILPGPLKMWPRSPHSRNQRVSRVVLDDSPPEELYSWRWHKDLHVVHSLDARYSDLGVSILRSIFDQR